MGHEHEHDKLEDAEIAQLITIALQDNAEILNLLHRVERLEAIIARLSAAFDPPRATHLRINTSPPINLS